MSSRSLEFDFSERPPERDPYEEDNRVMKREPPEGPRTFTVGELGRSIRRALDEDFRAAVWVEGEVASARPAHSGHVYFTLKDVEEDATIDVAIYKTNLTARTRSYLTDGKAVRLRGRPQFWAPRGRLQFIGDLVQLAGKGALLEALEKLKARLAAEGLFAEARKRSLPAAPRIVGVVTSPSGAVIHDIAKVAFRRGGANILLAPALVQGAGSAESVIRAISALERVPGVDVIIVGRGGGSSEDLMTWNDEELVRKVAACKVPIVSAVGHEVDVTLVDFVADARAATPSQAAEMVVADANAERRVLAEKTARLRRVVRAHMNSENHELARLLHRMPDPREFVSDMRQSIDVLAEDLEHLTRDRLRRERVTREALERRLDRQHPRAVLVRERSDLARATRSLGVASDKSIARGRGDLASLFGRLDAMSPLKVLSRGYAIATLENGHAVRKSSEVQAGDHVNVRVSEGAFSAIVSESKSSRDERDENDP